MGLTSGVDPTAWVNWVCVSVISVSVNCRADPGRPEERPQLTVSRTLVI